MNQEPARDAAFSGNVQSFARDADSNGNPDLSDYSARACDTDGTQTRASALKNSLFNLLPPATIAVILLFWAFGPASLVKNPWSIVVAGALTTAFVQALEWVH